MSAPAGYGPLSCWLGSVSLLDSAIRGRLRPSDRTSTRIYVCRCPRPPDTTSSESARNRGPAPAEVGHGRRHRSSSHRGGRVTHSVVLARFRDEDIQKQPCSDFTMGRADSPPSPMDIGSDKSGAKQKAGRTERIVATSTGFRRRWSHACPRQPWSTRHDVSPPRKPRRISVWRKSCPVPTRVAR